MDVLENMMATLTDAHEATNGLNKYKEQIQKVKEAIKSHYTFLYKVNEQRGHSWYRVAWDANTIYGLFRCHRCGNTFVKGLGFMIHHGKEKLLCPRCRWKLGTILIHKHDELQTSSGECKVMSYLDLHHITYDYGYICKHLIFKEHLHFDFWLPKYKIAIEYDGEQHFRPIKYFGGKRAFKIEKIRDHIKNRYCNTHHIKLIRIAYNQSIKKVLSEKLNRQLSLF